MSDGYIKDETAELATEMDVSGAIGSAKDIKSEESSSKNTRTRVIDVESLCEKTSDQKDGLATTNSLKPSHSPASYTTQFVSSKSLILSRMKSGLSTPSAASPTGAAPIAGLRSENQAAGSGEGLSATLAMSISDEASTLTAAASIGALRLHYSLLKRKREESQDEIDFAQSTMSFPFPTVEVAVPSTTKAARAHENEAKSCFKCGIDITSNTQALVTCHKCSHSWHQACIEAELEVDLVNQSAFACQRCSTSLQEKGIKVEIEQSTMPPPFPNHTETLRQKKLSTLPEGVVPAMPQLVGFPRGNASDNALTGYFYNKKRTDMLNVLSFCDQLKPQLLVDILVSVAKKHPDLPMFDSPDWNKEAKPPITIKLKHSHHQQQQQQQQQHQSKSPAKPRHGHTIPESKPKQKHKSSAKKPAKAIPTPVEAADAPVEDANITATSAPATANSNINNHKNNDGPNTGGHKNGNEDDRRGSLPPTWPRPGEGLYGRLAPDDEDRAFLLDENDEEAFSYFEVDRFGKQMAMTCA